MHECRSSGTSVECGSEKMQVNAEYMECMWNEYAIFLEGIWNVVGIQYMAGIESRDRFTI